ncbi:MAG: GNAT family N-acetyltransferase [Microcoleus sp. SIO2G3]|nr:GNAT family N-acetyltransferase [Microcoleus sp. SIO2G3]
MPTIQPYSPEYQEQVLALIRDIQQNEFAVAIALEDQPDLLQIPKFYQIGKGNFWIALDQGKVIGTIALIDIGSSQAVIRKMFVHPDYRGKQIGVGQQLLNTLLIWAKLQLIVELYLGTTELFKAAHRFYEKNGFTKITKAELPSTFPLMPVDTRFYQYTLSAEQDDAEA